MGNAFALRLIAALTLTLTMVGCVVTPTTKGQPALQFIAIGDAPYGGMEDIAFTRMQGEINASPHAFVLHVGDIKDGSDQRCDDALYEERRRLFAIFTQPFVLLPGDNDWTDCRRVGAGGFDPLERLAALRRVFFAARTLASGLPGLTQDRDFPELVAWQLGDVEFVGLHIVGSRDNVGFHAAGDAEQALRMQANLRWLDAAAVRAKTAAALVVAFHVNPNFDQPPPVYQPFIARLTAIAQSLPGKPILLIHGDTHSLQIDQPLRNPATQKPFAHVTRLETYGSPTVGKIVVRFENGTWHFNPEESRR
jgi:hypothetical protein